MVTSVTALALLGLIITGTYYDPIQSETGGEAIQLENIGNTAIPLSQVIIQTKGGTVPLPTGNIPPGGALLIADTGWSGPAGLRDNLSWPGADVEVPLSLANTAGWIEVRDKVTNETVNRLEWNASKKAREGKLFTDIGEADPFFRNSSSSVTTIPVNIIIANGPPIIENITVTDDSPTPGIQLMSYARTIRVEATLSEPNGEVFGALARFDGRDTEFTAVNDENQDPSVPTRYSADIALNALAPGSYSLTILASDGDATATQTVQVTVLASTTIGVSGPLSFSGTPGELVEDEITIANDGNVQKTVSILRVPAGAQCSPLTFTLAPGASETLTCSLIIPAGVPGEFRERVTVLVQ